jgi:hypothetical protein
VTLDDAVERFAALYRGRTDVQGTESGGCLRKRVTLGYYRGHLQGRFGLGIYPLQDDGSCAWAAVDIDRGEIDAVLLLRSLLADAGFSAVISTSRAKGYHVTLFVAGWARASQLRRVLHMQILEAGLPPNTEIYPRRDYRDVDSRVPGGYLRLPYLAALATGQPKCSPAPGRRVALDPDTCRPMELEAFLDRAEAGRVSPDLIRACAEDVSGDEEPGEGGEQPRPSAERLPGNPAELGLKPCFADLIRRGWSPDSEYHSRSEAQQAVADALVNAGHDDATIMAVMLNPAYGISARVLERSPAQAQAQVTRCIAKARASSRPRRVVAGGLIAPAVHRHMVDRGLPPLAWQVLAEISATVDYRTGVSIVTANSLARRLGRHRVTILRDAIKPLRSAGVLEAVPLERQDGRWPRIGHRLTAEIPRRAERECESKRSVASALHGEPETRAVPSVLNGTVLPPRYAVMSPGRNTARKSAQSRPSAPAPCSTGTTR